MVQLQVEVSEGISNIYHALFYMKIRTQILHLLPSVNSSEEFEEAENWPIFCPPVCFSGIQVYSILKFILQKDCFRQFCPSL